MSTSDTTPQDAARHILLRLGCTDDSGGVYQDDLDTISGIIGALVAPQRHTEQPHPLQRIKDRIDMRMNNHLCDMKPDYDDSITGFNEAWDIVRDTFAEAMKNGE